MVINHGDDEVLGKLGPKLLGGNLGLICQEPMVRLQSITRILDHIDHFDHFHPLNYIVFKIFNHLDHLDHQVSIAVAKELYGNVDFNGNLYVGDQGDNDWVK